MSKAKLYMMCGVSGSGKTTFAKQFAALHHLRYLSPDDFYALFNGDECNHIHEFEVWMALFRALHIAEQDGIDTVFDTNALSVVDRVQILDWFPEFEPHLICVIAPFDLCLLNNSSRRRVIPPEVMERMRSGFQVPDESEWAAEKRWQSMTMLYNESNNGFAIVNCRHRANAPEIHTSTVEYVNYSVKADSIKKNT